MAFSENVYRFRYIYIYMSNGLTVHLGQKGGWRREKEGSADCGRLWIGRIQGTRSRGCEHTSIRSQSLVDHIVPFLILLPRYDSQLPSLCTCFFTSYYVNLPDVSAFSSVVDTFVSFRNRIFRCHLYDKCSIG